MLLELSHQLEGILWVSYLLPEHDMQLTEASSITIVRSLVAGSYASG
jgi:hypothetical protein